MKILKEKIFQNNCQNNFYMKICIIRLEIINNIYLREKKKSNKVNMRRIKQNRIIMRKDINNKKATISK